MLKLITRSQLSWQGGMQVALPQMQMIQIKGKTILYDVNSMALWDATKLKKKGLIAKASDIQEMGATEIPFCPPNSVDFKHKALVFQATYACNLKCRYCFVLHHYLNHENTLTFDTAMKAIKIYQEDAMMEKGYEVGFFGGEPLLNWELIYKLSEEIRKRAKEKNLPVQMHITTNGTLITEEIADYCAKNNFSFIVSLDGTEDVHNGNRPYPDGQGSFKHVMRGLDYLASAYAKHKKQNPITLRATFDKEGTNLVSTTKFLNKLMYEGFAGHVSVEPSQLGEGCSTGKSAFEKLALKDLRTIFNAQYEETAEWFIQEIQAGRKPSLHHFEMPMQRMYDREPAFSECGAGKGYVSIGPGGKICACHREHGTEIGNIYKGGIDPIKQTKWLDNRFYARTSCPTCWRRHTCGGGCKCNSILLNHNLYEPSTVECLFRDMQMKWSMYILAHLTTEEKNQYSRIYGRQQIQKQQQEMQRQQMHQQPLQLEQRQRQQQPVQIEQKQKLIPKNTRKKVYAAKSCVNACQYECQTVCMFKKELEEQKQENVSSSQQPQAQQLVWEAKPFSPSQNINKPPNIECKCGNPNCEDAKKNQAIAQKEVKVCTIKGKKG